MKIFKLVSVLLLVIATSSFKPADYVDRLWALRGTPYSELTCSDYIDRAKQTDTDPTVGRCGAFGIWAGTCSHQRRIAEFDSLQSVDKSILLPGDILAFHGDHVAVYAGEGTFLDSDWSHTNKGVDVMRPNGGNAAWFVGPVRIVRWE